MHGFHLFLRTLGVGGIRDTQCGFKVGEATDEECLQRVHRGHPIPVRDPALQVISEDWLSAVRKPSNTPP